MKKVFLIAFLFGSLSFYAQGQRGGNGGGRSPQNQNNQGGQQREVREFKAIDVAGIFYYDVEEVVMKIKIKNQSSQNLVQKALRDYNFKVKEIAFLNSDKFKDLDEAMNSLKRVNRRQGNRNLNNVEDIENPITNKRDGVRGKVQNIIGPVRNEIREHEELLNEILENTLSEKQNKKWLKYQKKKKDSLRPKEPERGPDQRSNQNGNRRQMRGF